MGDTISSCVASRSFKFYEYPELYSPSILMFSNVNILFCILVNENQMKNEIPSSPPPKIKQLNKRYQFILGQRYSSDLQTHLFHAGQVEIKSKTKNIFYWSGLLTTNGTFFMFNDMRPFSMSCWFAQNKFSRLGLAA